MGMTELRNFFFESLTDSFERRDMHTKGEVTVYLVGLLERFIDRDVLFSEGSLEPITFQRYHAQIEPVSLEKNNQLKSLGDHCLFLTGYFYDFIAKNGQDQVDYHYNVGASAYSELSNLANQRTEIYCSLSDRFPDYCECIGDIRLHSLSDSKIIEDALNGWLSTGDQKYFNLLATRGLLIGGEGKS
jgi:hypothetical protein